MTQTMPNPLLTKLIQADVVCRDCGTLYGKYSVGCSSHWEGQCDVCGENKPVTEVRDWGYLGKGISELQGTIKEQSKKVANYMASVGPILISDDEWDNVMHPVYEQGEITMMLTEDEVGFLNQSLDAMAGDDMDAAEVALFESLEKKITALYEDNCVKYGLSPCMKAYNEKYGTWGSGSPEEEKRWEGFRDAFVMLSAG